LLFHENIYNEIILLRKKIDSCLFIDRRIPIFTKALWSLYNSGERSIEKSFLLSNLSDDVVKKWQHYKNHKENENEKNKFDESMF